MIKALRIDERLIHGQVAVAWCTTLNVDSVVVANDLVVKDEITVMSLKMAAPSSVRVVVKSIEDTIVLLNDPRVSKRTVLLLVNNPKDALELVKRVEGVPFVNVGNFGMLNTNEERKQLATSFAVTPGEVSIFKEIVRLRPNSNYQMTPTLTPLKISDLLKQL